jgi:hypothetical protein
LVFERLAEAQLQGRGNVPDEAGSWEVLAALGRFPSGDLRFVNLLGKDNARLIAERLTLEAGRNP